MRKFDGRVLYPTAKAVGFTTLIINFLNDSKMEDEVQFTIAGTRSLNEICNELSELFSEFCKENNFKENTVTSITYVGQDPDL